MNLPSIFKSAPNMQNSANTNKFIDSPVQQDHFGLGIQVFKIQQKKKQPPRANHINKKNGSVQKIREDARRIQNQTKRTSGVSFTKKQRKVPVPLPKLNSSNSGRSEINTSQTDNISSKKTIDRANSSVKKLESIKQFNPLPSWKSSQKKDKNLNKTSNVVKGAESKTSAIKQPEIIKRMWLPEMNNMVQFNQKLEQFKDNELTKVGKKKNSEFLSKMDSPDFISAYCQTMPDFYEHLENEEYFSIERYIESDSKWPSYESYDANDTDC